MNKRIYDKDYLTGKEFSELSGIAESTLRKYDKIGILHPAMRGSGEVSKRRHYSPTQVTMAKMIKVFSEMGVPLDTIKNLTKERTPIMVLKLLRKTMDAASNGIRFYKDVYSVIKTFVSLLQEGLSATETEIALEEMLAKPILLGYENDYSETIGFIREYIRFRSATHRPKLNASFPVGGYWESMDAFLEDPSRPTRFFSLDPHGLEEKAAGLYLVGYTRGYYGETNGLPERLKAFAKANGLDFTGPVYNIYLEDEISVKDPGQYLLQVSASVTEIGYSTSLRPHRRF